MNDIKREVIDVIRGISCLSIMLYHFTPAKTFPTLGYILERLGGTSVSLFFVGSALIISRSILAEKQSNSFKLKHYFIRRFFRIIPPWWFFLVFYFFYYEPNFWQLLSNIFFYFGFLQHIDGYSFIPFAWTLFIEECLYFLLPILLFFVKDKKSSFLLVILGLVSFFGWQKFAPMLYPGDPNFIFYRHPANHLVSIGLGVAIYFWHDKFYLKNSLFNTLFHLLLFSSAVFAMNEEVYFIAASLIIMMLWNPSFLLDIVCSKPLAIVRYIGVRCYSMYLGHDLIMIAFYKSYSALGLDEYKDEPTWWLALLFVTCTALLSMVTFRFIEVPSIRLGAKLIKRLS